MLARIAAARPDVEVELVSGECFQLTEDCEWDEEWELVRES